GSGLVAFAAATGVMPLDMPESVLVRFKGKMQPGITLRDLVHATELPDIISSLVSLVCLTLFLKRWQPVRIFRFGDMGASQVDQTL
ncbi:L-lactate permease, partial [Salmonella enterica subsp. enterica serovar Virginia]|nr:L-lactate permease [Salmonella enterica subsp. enterica serovar Virginia]